MAAVRRQRHFEERLEPLVKYDNLGLLTRYRFDKRGIEFISSLVEDCISPATGRNHSIPATTQVCMALRYYATGTMQLCSGDDFNVHQSTSSRIVNRVSAALSRPAIVSRFVKFPTDGHSIRQHKVDIHAVAGFPGVVGAVDGTHVRIIRPHLNEEEYFNRKNFHSINVQVIIDVHSRPMNVVAKSPGATHDSRILRESGITRLFETAGRMPIKCHLLGDSGYACKTWLMTPYLNPANRQQRRYNRYLQLHFISMVHCIHSRI